MAEVAGLAISAIPLIATFQSCLVFYDQIEALRHKNKDLDYIVTRAAFEGCRFSLQKGRLENSDATQHPALRSLVGHTLEQIQVTLKQIHKTLCLHLSQISDDGTRVQRSGNRLSRALKWLASDQQTVERMVSRLKELNEQFEALLPGNQLSDLSFGLLARSVATTNVTQLRSIQSALGLEHPAISLVAGIKALRIENYDNQRSTTASLPRCQITNISAFKWEPLDPYAQPPPSNTPLVDVVREERALAQYRDETDVRPEGLPVLVEWRSGFRSVSSVEGHRYRLDQLVSALKQIHPSSSAGKQSSIPVCETSNTRTPPPIQDSSSVSHEVVEFGVLECLGWLTTDRDFSTIGIAFRTPYQHCSRPISLYEKIKQDRRLRVNPPALETRFRMALKLAERVANLIAVGWIHKSMRSHNILIFEKEGVSKSSPIRSSSQLNRGLGRTSTIGVSLDSEPQKEHHKFESIYISGFSYTRPGDTADSADLSALPSHNPAFALYRPPISMSRYFTTTNANGYGTLYPESSTRSEMHQSMWPSHDASLDVYGLGIILLEIALWRTIDSIYMEVRESASRHSQDKSGTTNVTSVTNVTDSGYKNGKASIKNDLQQTHPTMTVENFQDSSQLRRIVQALDSRVGSIYRDVIEKCLTLNGWPRSPVLPSSPVIDDRYDFSVAPLSEDLNRIPPRLHSSTYKRKPNASSVNHLFTKDTMEEWPVAPFDGPSTEPDNDAQIEFLESILTSLSQCRA